MKACTTRILTGIGCFALCSAAQASIMIEGVDAPFTLESGSMPSLFGGSPNHDFSDTMITMVHEALQADGIVTDGHVTLLFADTADGLGFFALVDDVTGQNEQGVTELALTSSAPSTASYWVNDAGGDVDDVFVEDGTTTVLSSFRWNNGKGDGYAWSGLQGGDPVSFDFSPITGSALSGPEPFQFVTATDNGWEIIETGEFVDDHFAFNFMVPLPAPSALALFGILGLAGLGRRRSA